MALRDVITNVRDIVETPLTTPLDISSVFLIVGVVIVAIGFWSLILSHLTEAVKSVE